jgi:outer membrane receptor protein involved in Fe transport
MFKRLRTPGAIRFGLLLSVGLLLTAFLAFAQTTGTIDGTITDQHGGVLAGVTVEITSPNLQGTRTVTTGPNGRFRAPSLPPGDYKVTASLSGFGTGQKNAKVTLDATATVNIQMALATTAAVTVTGEAPLIDTASATTGSSYAANLMRKLPLGRNYAEVVRLQPGVQTDTGDQQGRGLALSLYGSTSAENLYLIDGINTTQVNRGVQGKVINNEFIQEVEVKTGGYQAEYGRSTGGVINVITKSGGNEFHGDVFAQYAASSFRADQIHESGDNFNLTYANVKGPDYGADLGGMFIKDRIWFFTAYNRSDQDRDRVPQEATSVLGQHFNEKQISNLFSGKLTFNIAQGSTLVGTYFRDPEHRDGAVFTPTGVDPNSYAGRFDIGAEDYAVRFNQLFGSFGVLALQYSKHKDRFVFKPLDNTTVGYQDRTVASDYPFYPTTNGFGSIPGYRLHNTGDRNEYAGSFTTYLGNHEFKVGGDWLKNVTTAVTSFTGGQRVRVRNCSASATSSSFCPVGEGVTYINYRGETKRVYFQHDFYTAKLGDFAAIPSTTTAPPSQLWSAFIQDTWRITPTLTMSAGFRYDVQKIQNADNITTINLNKQYQPRFGLVWDFKGDGSTKLFASYGRFYYAFPQDLGVRVYGSQFSTQTFNYSITDTTHYKGGGLGPPNRSALFQGGAAFQPVDNNLNGMYQDEYTLGVETALSPTFSVGLKAMYRNLGNVIEDRCDLDYNDTAINQGASCAITNPGSKERWAGGGGPNNSFPWCDNAGSAFVSDTAQTCFPGNAPAPPGAKRKFKGIELTAHKVFTQNVWAQFSYIYSTLRGNYDGAVRVASGQTDPGINADFDYPLFSRNADGRLYLDRPHQIRLDAVYTAPFGLSVGLGAFYRSGAPVSRYGWYNDFYPDLLHYVTRGEDNAVSGGRLPATYEVNLSLGYTVNVGPVSITPAVYIFNLLNRQAVTDVTEGFNTDGTFCLNAGGCTNTTINPDTGQPDLTDRNYARLGRVPYGGGLPQEAWARPSARQDPRSIRAALKISF